MTDSLLVSLTDTFQSDLTNCEDDRQSWFDHQTPVDVQQDVTTRSISRVSTSAKHDFGPDTYRSETSQSMTTNTMTASTVAAGLGYAKQSKMPKALEIPKISSTASSPISRTTIIQDWKGYVVNIQESTVTVRLQDMTAKHAVESEEAELPIQDISEKDRSKLRPGAPFRWVIGYEKFGSRGRRRFSEIYFRNVPELTKSERDSIQRESENFLSMINSN